MLRIGRNVTRCSQGGGRTVTDSNQLGPAPVDDVMNEHPQHDEYVSGVRAAQLEPSAQDDGCLVSAEAECSLCAQMQAAEEAAACVRRPDTRASLRG
jgi:hypothetical protein